MTGMDITIHYAFLPHTDAEAALAFYRDTLELEVRNDVGYQGMRWITVGPPGQPTSVVLYPPTATPGLTDDERRTITEMMAKGTFAQIILATKDLDATFARLQAAAGLGEGTLRVSVGLEDAEDIAADLVDAAGA